MDNFDNFIKDKLNNHEFDYDKSSWNDIKGKISKTSPIPNIIYIILLFITMFLVINTDITKITTTEIEKSKLISYINLPNINHNIIDSIMIPKEKMFVTDSIIICNELDTIHKPINSYNENYIEEEYQIDNYDVIKNEINFIHYDIIAEKIINNDTIDTNVDTTTIISTDTIIQKEKFYYLPNAFTPNGDGLNDVFGITGNNLNDMRFQLYVYDRWGNVVFESVHPEYKWDGHGCISGTYIWILKIQDKNGNYHIDKGNVTIINK